MCVCVFIAMHEHIATIFEWAFDIWDKFIVRNRNIELNKIVS